VVDMVSCAYLACVCVCLSLVWVHQCGVQVVCLCSRVLVVRLVSACVYVTRADRRTTVIVRLLLEQPNIDVNKGAKGWSPLALAQHFKHLEIVQVLKDAGAK